MQIAGNTCKVCGRGIVISSEGKFCPQCRTFAHVACEPAATCSVCGHPSETLAPITPDPRSEAFVPSALRPPRSGAPVLAVGLVLISFFVLLLFLIITHGHAFSLGAPRR